MALVASFTVYGKPVTQGSWEYKGNGRVTHAHRESLMTWRHMIRVEIQRQVPALHGVLVSGPVAVRAIFHVTKPPSIAKKRTFPIVAPDLDKQLRSLGDAMEKVLLMNDSQIVHWEAWKVYTSGPSRLDVEVWTPEALVVASGDPFVGVRPLWNDQMERV